MTDFEWKECHNCGKEMRIDTIMDERPCYNCGATIRADEADAPTYPDLDAAVIGWDEEDETHTVHKYDGTEQECACDDPHGHLEYRSPTEEDVRRAIGDDPTPSVDLRKDNKLDAMRSMLSTLEGREKSPSEDKREVMTDGDTVTIEVEGEPDIEASPGDTVSLDNIDIEVSSGSLRAAGNDRGNTTRSDEDDESEAEGDEIRLRAVEAEVGRPSFCTGGEESRTHELWEARWCVGRDDVIGVAGTRAAALEALADKLRR